MTVRSLDLGALELLVAVDDHGSLSAAARQLRMAQPNASRALTRLERRLGVQLLLRATTGSTLTAEGTVIAHWARRIVDDAAALLDVAGRLSADRPPTLAVGASLTVAEHLMPRWLAHYRVTSPETAVQLCVQNSSAVYAGVESGDYDLGFIESPTAPATLHSSTVAHDRLVVVVDPRHRWARRRRVLTAAELADTGLLVREEGSGTRTTVDQALTGYRQARPLAELGSSAAIRTAVVAGVGPAVLSTLAVSDELEKGTLHAIEVPELDLIRRLRAVWRSPRRLTGAAAELVHIAVRDRPGGTVTAPAGRPRAPEAR